MAFNLADLFEIVADTVPERECLVSGERRLTYAEVEERSNRLAHWLGNRGIGPGDHVALMLSNGLEYLESMIAAFKIRAVPVNVNYRYVADELRYLLDDADARAVVVHRGFADTLVPVAAELEGVESVLVVEDGTPDDAATTWDRYEDALAASSPARDFPPRSADDLYVLYTGGTTGMPKGVMWTHEDAFFGAFGGGNLAGEPISRPEELARSALDGHRRLFPASPFMHGTAHWLAFAALFAGDTVVMDPERHFDPERLWGIVESEQVNFLVIVGDAFARPMVEALDRLGDSVDVSSCRVILSGGAILSPTVKAALLDRLPTALVVDGYGASETGGHGQGVSAAGRDTVGPRFTVTDETAVLDEHLEPITESGVVGLLARRGHVPLGYYKDPERTAATFPVVGGVRWAVPGDFAVIEPDGSVTLLGRGSVSINTGGEKVYPEEVESVLKAHDSVFDAVVVGVPDERWGERVVAVVAPWPGREISVGELTEHARGSVAGYKVPRDVVVVDTIERAPSGKADYRWARTLAEDHVTSEGRRP